MRRIATLGAVLVLVASFAGTAQARQPDGGLDPSQFAPIRTGGFKIGLEKVTSGLAAPLKGVRAPGQPGRLYVIDQVGRLVSVDLAAGKQTVVLDVSARLVPLGGGGPGTYDERGFLGTAFHPDYARNGLLYTWTSEPNAGPPSFATTMPPGSVANHQNVLAEWHVTDPANPDGVVDPASRRELMRVDWPQANHDSGDLAFGPDGLLYIPMGDGGGADDQGVGHAGGNAQNPSNPLGKIHRIDVNGRDSANGQYGIPAGNVFAGRPGLVGEIFAWGFRNPWRLSFDSRTGALYVGDVGQNDLEEVSIVVSGGNYGWNYKEGALFFDPNGTGPGQAVRTPVRETPPGLQDPIAQYDTQLEGRAIIGGYVYHGSRVPQLRGRYVFADYSRLVSFPRGPNNYGRILYLADQPRHGGLRQVIETRGFPEEAARLGITEPARPPAAFPQTLAVLGMAEDASGELYVMGNILGVPFGTGGVVLRITAH